MGEIADEYVDRMIDGSFGSRSYRSKRPKTFQSGVGFARWRNSEGEIINMCDMDERYLWNCYNICLKKGNPGKAREIKEHLDFRAKDKPYDLGDW
jgi:hypothetical protein